jgi:acetyl esterase/lipase
VPFYGVFDFTNKGGVGRRDMRPFLERLVMKRSLAEDREAFEQASPLYRVHAGAPPFFVVHGQNDVLAPAAEARFFVDALRAVSSAPVAYAELPGAQHAFEVFISVRAAHAVRAVARFMAYLRCEHLRAREKAEREQASAA